MISGVVTILVLLSLAILQATRIFGARAAAQADAAQAALGAASGMDYAEARLCQDSMPGRWDVPGRADDWSCRDASILQTGHNPSYSHGESWADEGAPDGMFTPNETQVADRDGDGRHSAWSGRLRGGRNPLALRFMLRIESTEGKIPLNAGYLSIGDGIDNNGNGQVDEAGEADGLDNDLDVPNGLVDEPGEPVDLDGPPGGFDPSSGKWIPSKGDGLPDYNQVTIPYHASLALVLDNLGAMLFDPATGTRRWDIPTSGDPIAASWLGHDLITCRPLGGYRSWKQVETTLLNLPNVPPYQGAPYKKAEIDAIRPYLDLGPYGLPEEGARTASRHTLRTARYVPVNLWTAPSRVLESLWRYVTADTPAGELDWMTSTFRPDDFVAEPSGNDEISPFSQLPFLNAAFPDNSHRLILFPLEAERLANETTVFRRSGERGWAPLRKRLMDRADVLFQEDFNALANAAPAPADRMKWGWVAAKANLAFTAVCEDPFPSKPLGITPFWTAWGETIDANPSAPGRQVPPIIEFERLARFRLPLTGFDRGNPNPWGWPARSFTNEDFMIPNVYIRPQGLTLAPALRFSVESRVGPAALEGRLQAGERLGLTSQEDFENLTGGARFAGTGISVLEVPGLPIAARRGAPSGFGPGTVTLPRANRRSLTDPLAVPPLTDPLRPPSTASPAPTGRSASGRSKSCRLPPPPSSPGRSSRTSTPRTRQLRGPPGGNSGPPRPPSPRPIPRG